MFDSCYSHIIFGWRNYSNQHGKISVKLSFWPSERFKNESFMCTRFFATDKLTQTDGQIDVHYQHWVNDITIQRLCKCFVRKIVLISKISASHCSIKCYNALSSFELQWMNIVRQLPVCNYVLRIIITDTMQYVLLTVEKCVIKCTVVE